MAPNRTLSASLGKRKRVAREEVVRSTREPSPSASSSGSESEDAEGVQDIFRRAFEAKFAPLETAPKKPKIAKREKNEDGEEQHEEDWSGLSSGENGSADEEDDDTDLDDDDDHDEDTNPTPVQVVEYTDPSQTDSYLTKAEKRAFMSSKPPTSTNTNTPSLTPLPSKKNPTTSTDPTETTHLKNDAALQKLLRDSHLLAATSSGTSTPTASSSSPNLTLSGVARHKSTDLHLQALGAKGSVFAQKKMPRSQREAMAAKARAQEDKRRAEAKENGVVLERERKAGAKGPGRREKGVGGPSIGKFRGGTLSLSKRDVASITGGGGRGGKGKGKRGRR